jgi:iron complex outermembrane recepter protein
VVHEVLKGAGKRHRLLRFGVALLLCAASLQAHAARIDINIPMESAAKALVEFARQAGVSVLFPTERINQITTNAVRGQFEVKEALAVLLRGTGLVAELSDTGVLTVKKTFELGSSAMQSTEPKKWLPALIAALAAALAGHSSAQEASSTAPASEPGKLAEIIVTARRREENVQTVPIAITVLSQQTLQDNNVQTIGDLQYLVPSMSTTSVYSRDAVNVSIRGQQTSGISSIPAVVSYLNEVPIPASSNGDLAGGPGLLFDLESVQILKGPQGTLFGRNSVGGDLLLQTARPTNDFGGRVQLTYGNYNDREVDGAINLPIAQDVLLTRVAFNGQLRDGFTTVSGDGAHAGSFEADARDNWSVRGTVTFKPTESFQNDLVVTDTKYDSKGSPFVLTDLNPQSLAASVLYKDFLALLAQQQALGVRTVLPVDSILGSSGTSLFVSNTSRWSIADSVTFRNIFGYDVYHQTVALDADATVLPLLNAISTPSRLTTVEQYTDEAQLLGTAFSERLNWVMGAFWLDQVPPTGSEIPVLTQTILVPILEPSAQINQGGAQSKAVYAQGTYDLSAWVTGLKFSLGGRYTWDEVSNNAGTCPEASPNGPVGDCTFTAFNRARDKAPTWTIGLDYQIVPDTLLYLTSRRGYRAGGFNSVGEPGFAPEYVDDVELGVKSDWRVGGVAIRTNADIYYQDYKDIQVQQNTFNDATGEFSLLTSNAAAAQLSGAEFDVLADVTDGLQLGASFDYLHFKYTDFATGVNGAALIATEQTGRPPYKYNLKARYRLPLSRDIGEVSWQANWNWQAGVNTDTSQPGGTIPAFALLNMSADWNGVYGGPVDLSLFASNLTNKVYTIGLLDVYNAPFGFVSSKFGEPRMYGIRFSYRFGGEAKH